MAQVKTSITAEALAEIDKRRGRFSRSGFIAEIIENYLFGRVDTQQIQKYIEALTNQPRGDV